MGNGKEGRVMPERKNIEVIKELQEVSQSS
jgi:hypothetical protein